MPASEKIWASTYKQDSRLIKSISYYLSDEVSVAMGKSMDNGELFDASWIPPYIYWHLRNIPERKKGRLPAIFMIQSGVLCVQDRFRTFLEEFDLGPTRFYPTPLLECDQKTPRADQVHIFNLAATKDTVCFEETDAIEYPYGSPELEIWTKRIAVHRACLEGADMWLDPRIISWTFFSDRLVRAMKGKGFGRFSFRECDVLDD